MATQVNSNEWMRHVAKSKVRDQQLGYRLTCTKLIFPSLPTVTHCKVSFWISKADGTNLCRCSNTKGGESKEGLIASIRKTDKEPVSEARARAMLDWFDDVFIAVVRVVKSHDAWVSIHGVWPSWSGSWRKAISRVDRPEALHFQYFRQDRKQSKIWNIILLNEWPRA